MTDEEVLAAYKELEDYYGGNLPSPEHEPIRFAYYVKLFKYYNPKENTTS